MASPRCSKRAGGDTPGQTGASTSTSSRRSCSNRSGRARELIFIVTLPPTLHGIRATIDARAARLAGLADVGIGQAAGAAVPDVGDRRWTQAVAHLCQIQTRGKNRSAQ